MLSELRRLWIGHPLKSRSICDDSNWCVRNGHKNHRLLQQNIFLTFYHTLCCDKHHHLWVYCISKWIQDRGTWYSEVTIQITWNKHRPNIKTNSCFGGDGTCSNRFHLQFIELILRDEIFWNHLLLVFDYLLFDADSILWQNELEDVQDHEKASLSDILESCFQRPKLGALDHFRDGFVSNKTCFLYNMESLFERWVEFVFITWKLGRDITVRKLRKSHRSLRLSMVSDWESL